MAGSAATAIAVGSIAWYYHMYGRELHAMTEQEEGYVSQSFNGFPAMLLALLAGYEHTGTTFTDTWTVSTQPNTHGFINNI